MIPESSLDTQSYSIPDYVTVAPDQRLKATGLKQFLVGRNYRSDWITPIRVPVLDIGKEAGGLTPVRQSGGGQLRMLSFRDKKGQPWILRSVERFPQQVIPSDLRTPIDPELHEDANSAAYPFASLIVADLSRSAGIPTSRLKLVYVPDDPRFTRFRNDFSNRIGILEEVQPPGVRNTISTNQLMVNLRNEPYNDVDQKRVLQARLMDNFVLNFNRNENAWTWATRDTGRRKLYYPVPSHSSHAFFVSQGVIPKLAHRILAIPEIQGFDEKADNIVSFNRSAYNFDNRFLNGLTPQDWEAGIDTFLARISDSAITAAFRSGT